MAKQKRIFEIAKDLGVDSKAIVAKCHAEGIPAETVKNHMSSILRKLSVNDRTQAVVYAMRQGWIKIPED